MFRFDQLIRSGMTVSDVKQRYPSTVPLFEQFGFGSVCDDCDIATVARRIGLDTSDVLQALNDATFGPRTEQGERPNNWVSEAFLFLVVRFRCVSKGAFSKNG